MQQQPYPEIDKVIAYMLAHLSEPLTLAELADVAGYSPFHFTRVFKERMGVPPLYFFSNLRLQRAKELLLRTTLPVRDVGMEIGQQSLGTFTTRFAHRVGVTPAEFRRQAPLAEHRLDALRTPEIWTPSQISSRQQAVVHGNLHAEAPFAGIIFIGLFPRPMPEGLPLHGTLAYELGKFRITGVKPGIYYLMATAVSWESASIDILLPHTTLRTRSREPVIITSSDVAAQMDVTLFKPRLDDPPILISLSLLMNNFMQRMARSNERLLEDRS